jgi:hypothetical protein
LSFDKNQEKDKKAFDTMKEKCIISSKDVRSTLQDSVGCAPTNVQPKIMKVIDRLRDDCKTGVIFTNRDPKDITAFMKGYRKDRCSVRIDIVFEDGVRLSTSQFIPHYIKGEVKEKLVQDLLDQDPVVAQQAH